MANLTELPGWVSGIYQLEESDPVQGGAEGIDNLQAKQLASRTSYLKQAIEAAAVLMDDKAPLASPLFTGNPGAPTPAQFDNDSSLATTAFVQRALGNSRAFEILSASRALTAGDAGKTLFLAGNITITLPDSTTLPSGCRLKILSSGGSSAVLAGSSIINSGGSIVTVINGYSVELFPRTDINQYRAEHTGAGFSSLSANGFQMLPSGLIIQWGEVATPASGIALNIPFPIAFPNTCWQIAASYKGASSSTYCLVAQVQPLSNAVFNAYLSTVSNGGSVAGVATNNGFSWIAVGY